MPEASSPIDPKPAEAERTVRLQQIEAITPGAPPEAGIGRRLVYARGELSLSVEALARLTRLYDTHDGRGVSATSLARYESGESLPGARELRLLCEALAVPAQWLLLGMLPHAGRDVTEQALIAALDAFVRAKQNDLQLGDAPLSEVLDRFGERQRFEWMTEARKPSTG